MNSKPGVQFRISATRTLKDHWLRGYTLNEKRLRERRLGEIEQAVGLLTRTLTQNALVADEARAEPDVVQSNTRALDSDTGEIPSGWRTGTFEAILQFIVHRSLNIRACHYCKDGRQIRTR